jgi:DNA mismatch repair protein MutS2
MIYPDNFESKIGFDRIRELLEVQCISPLGRKHVAQMDFESGHGIVQEMLNRADEFRQILLSGQAFPNSGYFDLTDEIRRIQLKGTYMEPEQLFDLKSSLQTINNCLLFFKQDEEGLYPNLSLLTEGIEPFDHLLSEIERIMDDKGMIRDSASPELKDIRQKLHRKQLSIDGRIRKSITEARKAGLTPEDAEATIRNGRMVIPVLASGKRQMQGFIHDESATGQTVFIEPAEVFDLNNEIRELENAERREVINILIAFTDRLRPESDVLFNAYDFLGYIDFIRAKAKLALRINAVKPIMKPTPMFAWRNARHPLLFLAHKEQDKPVVPMDLDLNRKDRILVISGPNAGGKSVCLKTAGLLQYMLQCGLLIPMEENSEAGIFQKIFLDIGDEQSLENDLSTYSSHLINIREFIAKSDRNSLFLIDEFGTGTEPHLGGAIAEAALQKLNNKKAFGVVTTHYANIKLMADREAGIINGAMLFDTNEMKPLYILRTGKPGSSFAFEIARKIGFQEDVLDHAASITGYSQVDFEKQLQELETEKLMLEKEKLKFGVADDFLAETIGKYEKLISELNEKKSDIIEEARKEAADILGGANRAIEHTIKGIREAEAEKERTKTLRKKLEAKKQNILKKNEQRETSNEQRTKSSKPVLSQAEGPKTTDHKPIQKPEASDQKPGYLPGTPEVGDWVELTQYGSVGEVIDVKGKKATIVSGSVNIKVSLKDLKKVKRSQKPGARSQKRHAYSSVISDLNKKAAQFNPSIDLRGKRALEALDELKSYIDDAILLSIKEVSILHGKGDGILRNVLREYLQTVDDVEQISDAHVERGGQGITIVRLK